MQVQSIGIQPTNVEGIIHLLREGLPANAFDKLRDRLHITDHRLSKIVQIPKRTLSRRRSSGRLKTDESERVLRIAWVYEKAVDVFESDTAAQNWLKKPARGLGYHIPLEYADTDLGAQEIIKLLGRIAHGVFPG